MKIISNTRLQFNILNTLIAIVWFVNGLFCKIMNLVPRHEEIVAVILGKDYARALIIIIGILEVFMGIWVLSNYHKRFNTYTQILVIAAMNIIEFIVVPELLLWGKINILFAAVFILIIYLNYSKLYLQLNKTRYA
ncbi:DoxX-like family protein [Polluticaenibacter yanchengensis]|uniref:DoxX-like family protein n=1 Tax=Polluticaenibacter yanchengensis TaxID=3014562 RepID=A0ABT4UPI2_9BACT|nr:DoxX-like family protein [Chitinophagaceae bacterium LY-5]